jgi:hypothetical protein
MLALPNALWWGNYFLLHSAAVKPCLLLALVLGVLVLSGRK